MRLGAGTWVSIPCLLQDTSHFHWFHLPKQSTRKKTKNVEMRSNSQKMVSHCLGLHTQNSQLRKVELERSPKRGIDKINMLKRGRNTQNNASHIKQPWINIWIPALREVDLEPSGKSETNRTRPLESLYWLSRSLHFKQFPNQLRHKSTKVYPIRSSQTSKKSDQIPKSYALQYIKTISPKTTTATNTHDWSHNWGCHSQR